MKKIILGLLLGTVVTISFADTVITQDKKDTVVTSKKNNNKHNDFDSTKIECGTSHVSDGINKTQLKEMHCKKYSEQQDSVYFFDDHSKKLVHCKTDKAGNVSVTECKAN